MPASLVGGLGCDLMGGMAPGLLPLTPVVDTWSEPAYATIGLGTGTMASYARPYQTVHFYEIDDRIKRLSLPVRPGDRTYFTYLEEARKRGANVNVLMGDARLRMAEPWNYKDSSDPAKANADINQWWQDSGLDRLNPKSDEYKDKFAEFFDRLHELRGGPESFYHLIVVDAFSSDAIPVHLITMEAIEMYMSRLVPEGVLCVHTSNRHVELVPVVAKVANAIELPKVVRVNPVKDVRLNSGVAGKKQSLVCKRGHDNAYGRDRDAGMFLLKHIGHYTSEWVLVAHDKEDLSHLFTPANNDELFRLSNEKQKKAGLGERRNEPYWTTPALRPDLQVWTDDYSNLLAVFRWPWQSGH